MLLCRWVSAGIVPFEPGSWLFRGTFFIRNFRNLCYTEFIFIPLGHTFLIVGRPENTDIAKTWDRSRLAWAVFFFLNMTFWFI